MHGDTNENVYETGGTLRPKHPAYTALKRICNAKYLQINKLLRLEPLT